MNTETIKHIQQGLKSEGLYDGVIDGLRGPKTNTGFREFVDRWEANPVVDVTPSGSVPARQFDERTESNLATLLPAAQPRVRAFMVALLALMPDGVTAKIISGNRSYAEQDALYAKGRTSLGKIVTNARGGYSNHNFGVAVDVGLFRGGTYLEDGKEYKLVGKAAKATGLDWGGDWKSIVDEPHVEVPTGYSLAEMRTRVAQGKPVLT